jgi:hypothetical protein
MMAEVDLQVKYAVPSQRWRAAAFHCTTSTAWELAVMAAILANCAAMALTHADMDDGWQAFMTWANLSFTAFFLLEVVLTLIALGVRPVLRVPCSRGRALVAAAVCGAMPRSCARLWFCPSSATGTPAHHTTHTPAGPLAPV